MQLARENMKYFEKTLKFWKKTIYFEIYCFLLHKVVHQSRTISTRLDWNLINDCIFLFCASVCACCWPAGPYIPAGHGVPLHMEAPLAKAHISELCDPRYKDAAFIDIWLTPKNITINSLFRSKWAIFKNLCEYQSHVIIWISNHRKAANHRIAAKTYSKQLSLLFQVSINRRNKYCSQYRAGLHSHHRKNAKLPAEP